MKIVYPAFILMLALTGCDDGTGGNTEEPGVLTSVEAVIEYLADPGLDGTDPDNPVQLAVRISAVDFPRLFQAVGAAGKYVSLDLTRCYNVLHEFDSLSQGNDYKIVSLSLPKGITSISGCAFDHWTSLMHIDLPAGLRTVGYAAFADCTSLAEIDLPASLAEIGAWAFQRCTGLELVTCRATTPPLLPVGYYMVDENTVQEASGTQFDNANPNLAIKVPADSVAVYKAAWHWRAERISAL